MLKIRCFKICFSEHLLAVELIVHISPRVVDVTAKTNNSQIAQAVPNPNNKPGSCGFYDTDLSLVWF